MIGEIPAIGLYPRRQWSLWLILILCLVWTAMGVARQVLHQAGDLFAVIPDVVITAFPPVVVALFITNLIRGSRASPDLDLLEGRLVKARNETEDLDSLLKSVNQTLTACAERTEQIAAVASDEGRGLIANANLLSATVSEVRQAGIDAEKVAARLVSAIPDLGRLTTQIEAMGGKLHGETVQQLQIIEALLASVQLRGDEISAQSDVAITSMNKQLAEVDEQSRQTTSRIAKRAYALDAAVDGASSRAAVLLEAVGERIAKQMATMDDHMTSARMALDTVGEQGAAAISARLDQLLTAAAELGRQFADCKEKSDLLHQATDDHLDALPARLIQVRHEGEANFDHLVSRATALHANLSDLQAPFASSGATLELLAERLNGIRAVAADFETTLASGLPMATDHLRVLGAGTAALTHEVAELKAVLTTGEEATRKIGLLVGDARTELTALGEVDLRMVDDRMNATAIVMHDIGRQIGAYGSLSSQTKAMIESDLASLDRRLRVMQDESEARLATMSDQIGGVREAIESLNDPIATARTMLGDVDSQVARVADESNELGERLDGRIAAIAASFAVLNERAEELLAGTSALEAATVAGSATISAVSDLFARERTEFAVAAAALGTEFDRVRGVLNELDMATERVSVETAGNLGQTFERVRILAEASAASLRDLLCRVVAEAETALERSGSAAAEAAFGEPIRREVLAIEDAANRASTVAEAAAQRVSGQTRSMETMIDGVDAKVQEIETRLDIRARDTLSARSTRLIEMLGDASVDVARLLSIDAGEKAWMHYLKGDRSIFARRTVRLIDRQTTQKIARHFAHDAAFSEEASRYLDIFEKLSGRLSSDPDGDALLATVVSSDIGKLYVAIARATGRWSPTA